ncbi:MAG: glucosamine-6-phosphate deaminase [Spirochaetes bacterium]|nr:MAG: glucosamine-6-phosphate deaminase [Spirochaetota bacterium]
MASSVEKHALELSGQKMLSYPDEKIVTVVVENFPMLGRLTAVRFLEWVQQNPEGVVSLPTGKTPEYFIKEVIRLLNNWDKRETGEELSSWGIDVANKPNMKGLRFVQIDEFYPMNPYHHNSFYYYINRFYLEGFGIDKARALTINCEKIGLPEGMTLEEVWDDDGVDLTLRYRSPINEKERLRKRVIESVDYWCTEYEERIRSMGGIGFFLGGIGPDGHIGFNVRGSDMYSTTRLTNVNYETQAAAAADLGGMEVARKRLVITIGLSTITYNPDCTAIIIAAGEAKARIVADSIRSPRTNLFPATALQVLPKARFFLTGGAARELKERSFAILARKPELSEEDSEKIVIDISLSLNKKISRLNREDYETSPFGRLLLKREKGNVKKINERVEKSLRSKIEEGMTIRRNKCFLHTEPHHDDIMLGYLPFVVRHIREHSNHHFFATMTSGFTSVTNKYMLDVCLKMRDALEHNRYNLTKLLDEGYFDPGNSHYKNRDVWNYLDGVASGSEKLKEEGMLRRFLRDLIEIYDDTDLDNLYERVVELVNYFETQYPGKKDLNHIQKLKGMCREWESSCLWGYFGWDSSSIKHLRLGFYQGDIFTEEPTVQRDVLPILELLEEVKPDVVTVTLDPEASGPDTHYKVLQAISEALRQYQDQNEEREIEVIGYRNIWYRFHPSEANIYIPVSLNMLTLQHYSFMNTYISQKDASFPSWEHDGPFPELAQKIQVEQYQMLKTCLGRDFFYEHPSALIRATRGFVFIKSMKTEEFYNFARELRRKTESDTK